MTKTRDYIETKKIGPLFEELMRHVLNKKPANPVPFLIKLLQDKGESIIDDHVLSGLGCEGQAIDIRKSLERFLPRSVTSKPISANKDTTDEPTAALPSSPQLVRPTSSPTLPDRMTEGDIVVTKEHVAPVESFNWGAFLKKDRTTSASSSGSETLQSEQSDTRGRPKKRKNKQKKKKGEEKEEEEEDEDKQTFADKNFIDNVSLDTETCDLTEVGSWAGGDWEVDTLSHEDHVEFNNTVDSAAPLQQLNSEPPVKQNEADILEDEGFCSRTPNSGMRNGPDRVTTPCGTVFFDDSDGEPPVLIEPADVAIVRSMRPVRQQTPNNDVDEGAVFTILDTPRSDTRLIDRNVSLCNLLDGDLGSINSDKMSISELSGFEWTYAESVG